MHFNFLRALWHHLHPNENLRAGELYQTSLMSALMAGVYDGTVTLRELAEHGDFGLGTFNDLDGEMVLLQGRFYQFKSDGEVVEASPEQKTPFAAVTFFQPQRTVHPQGKLDKAGLLGLLDRETPANLFTAIYIQASFPKLQTRAVKAQHQPFRPLTEATKDQVVTDLSGRTGSLVGFRTPVFAQGWDVAGYHLHFLDIDRTRGGHMLDCDIEGAEIQLCTINHLHVELPETTAFENATFETLSDVSKGIAKAEG